MPNVKVFDMAGKEVGEITLSDVIFGADVNGAVLHAAVRAYLMNQRQGTGRARQGSTRSPQWTHGGVALGPKPRDYRTGMNKKTKRLALYSALSAKVAEGSLIVVDDIKCDSFSTKTMANMLKALGSEKKALVVLPGVDKFVVKSCANIAGVKTSLYNTINVYDILNADKFIIAKTAVEKLEEVYA